MEIKYFKVNENAPDIDCDFSENAGIDLYAASRTPFYITHTGEYVAEVTACYVFQLPPGVHGMVAGRSGNAFKRATIPFYGIIDSSYRGPVKVRLESQDKEVISTEIAEHQAIAQLVLLNYSGADLTQCKFVQVNSMEELSQTTRGDSGFGSTGNMV